MPPLCPGFERVRSPIYPHYVRGDTELVINSLLRMVRTVAAQGIWAVSITRSVGPKHLSVNKYQQPCPKP